MNDLEESRMEEGENLLQLRRQPPQLQPRNKKQAPAIKMQPLQRLPQTLPQQINIDVEYQDSKLMSAVEQGNLELVEELLQNHGATEQVNEAHGLLRVSPIHIAAFLHPDLVPVLLNHGADVRATDKLGRTALHLACTAGNDTCVASLLRSGADVDSQVRLQKRAESPLPHGQKANWNKLAAGIKFKQNLSSSSKNDNKLVADNKFCSIGNQLPVPECWDRTPLHQAVKAGHPACVRLLLHANASVFIRDELGLTPLLLAGAGVSPEDLDAVAKYEEIVSLLVDAGADVNVNVNELNPDTVGSSALHHAAARCSLAATKLLIEKGADVTKKGANGETPLHEAAHWGADQVLSELLAAPDSLELVNMADHVGCTPLHKAAYSGARDSLALLLRHGGDLAACTHSKTSVLDAIFMYIPRPSHFLAAVLDSCVTTNNASVLDRSFKVHLDFTVLAPHGSDGQTAVMRGLLSSPGGPGHGLLLRHPLLETFLRLKWQRLRVFFFFLLFIYVCFLISLSVFVTVIHLHESPIPILARSVARMILIGTSTIVLLHIAIQALLLPMYYLRSLETWMTIVCLVLSLVISINRDGNHNPSWIPHLTSFTMLLAWTELMLLIGRFPIWGNYALMFYTVLRNVMKVLLTFVCIVFGFALSFFVQFDTHPMFNNPWKAFVKTMVMMTGEFEYQELFGGNTTENTSGTSSPLPVTSRIIFLIFVVLASIVMVNLMVGLAVSDIQGIQAEGHLRRLLKQAEFVDHLEILISHKIFNKLFPRCILMLLSRRRGIVTKLTLQPSATESKNRCPHHLPHRLLEACVELAVRRRAMSVVRNNEDLWQEFGVRGQRISWYVDNVDQGSRSTLHSSTALPSIDELLVRVSSDLRSIKEMLGPGREPSVTPSPRTMSPNRLQIPRASSGRTSRRASRFADVVAEMQGAQIMLRRIGRATKTEWM